MLRGLGGGKSLLNARDAVVRHKAIFALFVSAETAQNVCVRHVVARGFFFGDNAKAHESDLDRFADLPCLLAVGNHLVAPK